MVDERLDDAESEEEECDEIANETSESPKTDSIDELSFLK
jgi:hypothetical protein